MKKIIGIVLVFVLVASLLFSEEGYLLKFKGKAGEVSYYQVQMKVNLHIKGQQGEEKLKLENDMKIKKQIKAIEGDEMEIITQIVKGEAFKNGIPILIPDFKRKVVLKQKDNGEIISQKYMDQDADKNPKSSPGMNSSLVFPSYPLKVGDSWKNTVLSSEGIKMEYEVTLSDIQDTPRGKIAVLKTKVKFLPVSTALRVKGSGSGKVLFNIEEGDIISSELKTKLKVEIPSEIGTLFENTTETEMKMQKLEKGAEKE